MNFANLSENQIKELLNLVEKEPGKKIKKAQFSPLEPVTASSKQEEISFLNDINIEMEVELGNTTMKLGEVLKLEEGSVITLNKMAGDMVDLYLNGKWLAKGEIVVINEVFGIRLIPIEKGENPRN